MAASSTALEVEAALLLVVVALLLPLRLLSFVLRLSCGSGVGELRRAGVALAAVAALLAAIYAVPGGRDAHAREGAATIAVAEGEGFRREVRSEIGQLKLQIARLESFWKDNSKTLDSKADTLEDNTLMKAMTLDIQSLINEQENIKESLSSSYSDDNIKAMENEVQLLKDESRKMNSKIYKVWSLARDAEKRVEALYSYVKKGFKDKRGDRPFWTW